MNGKRTPSLATVALFVILLAPAGLGVQRAHAGNVSAVPPAAFSLSSAPPGETAKLIFIHHSSGENWLGDDNGGLGIALRDNNYFVSDTNYGWGPGGIGDTTDIGHWWRWFRGTSSAAYLGALYTEYDQHSSYSRLPGDPGGENEIIMFKSCYPNSNLMGNPGDSPTTGSNPLRGEDPWSPHHTVGNAKGIYNDILEYFETRQDKLFVVVTAPPMQGPEHPANARALDTWLVEEWLADYEHNNVVVFDFYNVLTSNGGTWDTNDLGWATGNHHRYADGVVEYTNDQGGDVAAYPDGGNDDHPSSAGNQKATGEFVPLLNYFYGLWRGGEEEPTPTTTGGPPPATVTATHTSAPVPTPGTPTPTTTPLSGQYTVAFQQGVSPDPLYSGTTDVILAHDVATNVNLGGAENLETFYGEAENRRSLVRWELSSLPADISVISATLELYRYDGDAASAMEVALYRVTRDWTEGTGWDVWPDPSYAPDGATWLNAGPGVPWDVAGGDYDTSTDYGNGPNGIIAQTTLLSEQGNGWIRLNATAAVRAWIEGGAPNYGVLLRPQSGEYTYHYYCSRDYETPNLRPRLIVIYTVGGAVTPTPTGPVQPSATPTPTSADTPIVKPWLHLPIILKSYVSGPEPTATPLSPASLDVPLVVTNAERTGRIHEPVTSGLPIARRLNLTDLSTLRLVTADGEPVPCQFTPLARWGGAPDDASKPVRWLLLDFQASVPADSRGIFRLSNSGGEEPEFPTLRVSDEADSVTVNTGPATFNIRKSDGNLTAPGLSAPVNGRLLTPAGTEYFTSGPVTVTVSLRGPMRASVRVQGAYRDGSGTALLRYTSRYWFYAGQRGVRLFHTVENSNLCPLVEDEQFRCFDIGSGGSVDVADISLVIPFDLAGPLTYQAGGEGSPVGGSLSDRAVLYQDSSGTDHWDHYAKMTDWYGDPLDARPRMQAYVDFTGYRTFLGETIIDSGDHAAGWLTVTGGNGGWAVAVRDFWQNFPKALRASPEGALEIGLFPEEFGPYGYAFNLRAGEHKTHEILLYSSASGEEVPAPWVEAFNTPLFAQASPDWYAASGGLSFLSVRNYVDWPEHEYYLDHQLDTAPTYEQWMDWFPNLPTAIESTDFYGIFDYGDVPIDYEGRYVSPINLKYHMDYGMWMQWARSGDQRWFDLAEAADRHIADADILHNLHSPRHWGDGIMFGHSAHDELGFTNPHRNYNSGSPDMAFGVPGLLTSYYLTGYEKAYEAALELADCIEWRLRNDVYLCSHFPGDCSGHGWALFADGMYDGNTRPVANSLQIVVEAYRATGDSRYLEVADALVDWAKAGNQSYIDGPTGEDQQMRPWMLNVYLLALADYLEMRSEFGLADLYDGTGSFLAYADFLRTYPWIDLSPTEAQPRAAYAYQWWFDGRTGIPGEDNDNDDPSVNNWLLAGADALAYAHRLSGDADYLERATSLFRTGSHDPWFEGDANTYTSAKEMVNAIVFGQVFLNEWAAQQ